VTAGGPLRVIDFGTAAPLRSQTLWHAVAYGVSGGAAPTLSFVRPSDPYVSIGYHRRLDEVDLDACAANGWPVYRRMIGGGPVYLDDGQLFFQITVPIGSVPAARHRALRWLLAPVIEAFRAVGVPAELDDHLEIVVGDRKVCGYGAGQIGEAAIVAGNLIIEFDHDAAASILRTPSPAARDELAGLIHRYVAATPAAPAAFKAAATRAYGEALGLVPFEGRLSELEWDRLDELDRRFCDPGWVEGPARPRRTTWQAKIRAGVWMFAAEGDGAELVVCVDNDRVLRAQLHHPGLNGSAATLGAQLTGLTLAEAASTLDRSGDPGRCLAGLIAHADPGRSL
jgi:lipoate-protein ligase A